MSTNIGTLF